MRIPKAVGWYLVTSQDGQKGIGSIVKRRRGLQYTAVFLCRIRGVDCGSWEAMDAKQTVRWWKKITL